MVGCLRPSHILTTTRLQDPWCCLLISFIYFKGIFVLKREDEKRLSFGEIFMVADSFTHDVRILGCDILPRPSELRIVSSNVPGSVEGAND